MWQSSKAEQSGGVSGQGGRISRLECIQVAMEVHLDRLKEYFPDRKVAIVAFHSSLECFIGAGSGTMTHIIDSDDIKNLGQGMDVAHRIINTRASWPTVRENIDTLRKHVRDLRPKGSTALGPALAVALGLARHHKREHCAQTEIFLCTDGKSNTGIGSTDRQYIETAMHGPSFYSQAGEIALGQSARINIIGIGEDGVALDIIGVAAQISGGIVTTVQADEVRREIRTASQRRVIATDITIKVYMPKQWHFVSDPRPGIAISGNTLIYTLLQIDDESTVGFAYAINDGPDSKRNVLTGTIPFQVQITYTSTSTGSTNVRILNKVIPVTGDRRYAEKAAHVASTGTYVLQKIAYQANEVLVKDVSSPKETEKQLRTLRDTLYASHQLLIRAAKAQAADNTAQEELWNFRHESAQLDEELDRMASGETFGSARDQAVRTFARMAVLSSNSLLAARKKIGQVKRRAAIK